MRSRDAGSNIEVDRALDVEQVSVTRVHVNDNRWNVEMNWRDAFLGIAYGHRELKLAKCADRAAGAVSALHPGGDVHVRRAAVAARAGGAAGIHPRRTRAQYQ